MSWLWQLISPRERRYAKLKREAEEHLLALRTQGDAIVPNFEQCEAHLARTRELIAEMKRLEK